VNMSTTSLEFCPQLTKVKNYYSQLFSEAGEYEQAFRRCEIASLEQTKIRECYSIIIRAFEAMQENAENISAYFESPIWVIDLLNAREAICRKAQLSDQGEKDFSKPLALREANLLSSDVIIASKQNEDKASAALRDAVLRATREANLSSDVIIAFKQKEDKASAVLRAAVKSDFMANMVKNLKPSSPEVENFFREKFFSVKDQPESFAKVTEVGEWFMKLVQITWAPEDRQTYVDDTRSIPDEIKMQLVGKLAKIDRKLIKLTNEQFVQLIADLKSTS